jgi:ferredoxin
MNTIDRQAVLIHLIKRVCALCFAQYQVEIISKSGRARTVEIKADQYIMDATDDAGISIPYSCRAGNCAACLGKLKSGTVDQSHNGYLNKKHVAAGYVLTCYAYPTSDCSIEVEIDQDDFFSLFS